MAYSNNKPLAADRISASQAVLLDDFIAIDTGWLVNHVNLNLPNTGKHHYITLPNNTFGAGFPYTTLANEVALYSESGNLYFRPAGQAVGVHDNDVNLIGGIGATNPGWSLDPSGVKMLWFDTGAVTNDTAYTIPTAGLTTFANIFSVQVTTVWLGVNLAFPVCFWKISGTGTPLDPFRVWLKTNNGAGHAGAKILVIGN